MLMITGIVGVCERNSDSFVKTDCWLLDIVGFYTCLSLIQVHGSGLFFFHIRIWKLKLISRPPASDELNNNMYQFKE